MERKKIFPIIKIGKYGIYRRLFGKKNKVNAIQSINKLLSAKDLLSITIDDIYQIASDHHVNLRKDLQPEFIEIYRKYLKYCLSDKYLSDKEVTELKHLKEILSINDTEVRKAHNEIAGELYKMEVVKAIEDGRLDEDEKIFLEKIQNNLKLPDHIADKIYQAKATDLLKNYMNEALSDKRLTEEEECELGKIKESLNIDVHFDGLTRANYEKYKLFWQIENGELPEFDVDLSLEEDEKCYFYTDAEWLNQKTRNKKNKDNHSQLNLKIAKGLYLNSENKEMKPELEDIWATMDNGKIYLTNNRINLSGNERNIDLYLDKIIDFSTFKNGINIIYEDHTIFLQFREHTDIFSLILGQAITNV